MIRFKYIQGVLKIGDFFWHAINIAMWSTIEAGTCIIAACTATLKPLLNSALGRVYSTTPTWGSGSAAPMSHQSKRQSLHRVRAAGNDLEYGSTEHIVLDPSLTKPPEYALVEFVTRPDSAHIATESGVNNLPSRTHSMIG